MGKKKERLTFDSIWKATKASSPASPPTAKANIDLILGSLHNKALAVSYWKPFFLFFGARDSILWQRSGGQFPNILIPEKKHPVISLKKLPDNIGCKVNPCSSIKPWTGRVIHFIEKGCKLKHTGHVMDRNSYIVDQITLPWPASRALELSFKGEVPLECIKIENRKRR
jgi:hypothetical protein